MFQLHLCNDLRTLILQLFRHAAALEKVQQIRPNKWDVRNLIFYKNIFVLIFLELPPALAGGIEIEFDIGFSQTTIKNSLAKALIL